jgi:hypothetical protein
MPVQIRKWWIRRKNKANDELKKMREQQQKLAKSKQRG